MVDANMDPLAFLKQEEKNGDQHIRVQVRSQLHPRSRRNGSASRDRMFRRSLLVSLG